ncbi:hypothetical protein K438DRAFT_1780226 [Mycena galopus ATCC 62051]|nr:hypothetical protein K438DRAFT_1780226 [Mycena galopus ATCC 62051]
MPPMSIVHRFLQARSSHEDDAYAYRLPPFASSLSAFSPSTSTARDAPGGETTPYSAGQEEQQVKRGGQRGGCEGRKDNPTPDVVMSLDCQDRRWATGTAAKWRQWGTSATERAGGDGDGGGGGAEYSMKLWIRIRADAVSLVLDDPHFLLSTIRMELRLFPLHPRGRRYGNAKGAPSISDEFLESSRLSTRRGSFPSIFHGIVSARQWSVVSEKFLHVEAWSHPRHIKNAPTCLSPPTRSDFADSRQCLETAGTYYSSTFSKRTADINYINNAESETGDLTPMDGAAGTAVPEGHTLLSRPFESFEPFERSDDKSETQVVFGLNIPVIELRRESILTFGFNAELKYIASIFHSRKNCCNTVQIFSP